MAKKEKRAQRAEDFKNQKVKNVQNFNYDQHNRKDVEGTHISGQESKYVRKEGGRQAAYESLKAQKDAGATFGKRAQKQFDRMEKNIAGKNDRQAAKERAQAAKEAQRNMGGPTQTATNTGDIKQQTEIKNTQEQNVNQDNDVNTSITGDNNKVFNNQDNSIRQYGGDNRSLVINEANTGNQSGSGSSGGYYNTADKAISMATLGGFYDADDSPGAQASFVDQQQTMNRDAQKRYAGQGLATAAQYTGFRGGNVDMGGLQSRIDGNAQYFQDKATMQEVKTYGDRAAVTDYPTFEFGDPLEEVTSNADQISEQHKDDIDDM
jgi:hypothetical protein